MACWCGVGKPKSGWKSGRELVERLWELHFPDCLALLDPFPEASRKSPGQVPDV